METGLLAQLAVTIIKGLTLLTDYLANSNTFPQPLSEVEEAQYLAWLQKGDEEARAVLIERNLRLVAHIIKALWALAGGWRGRRGYFLQAWLTLGIAAVIDHETQSQKCGANLAGH